MSISDGFDYVTYGSVCDPVELERFLGHTMTVNDRLVADGRRGTPVCVWGRHGIGKTDIVESVARARGAAFVSIAPAQFEEMGDLLGMPVVVDGGAATAMAPPEWVPREDVPGVLLIDDVNRADDRILRGLMQLLQRYRLASWSLPPRWQIVLTANPDGGDYSVTPMDDAMLTRMLHVTLRFDVKRWAAWAETQGMDPRGIAFVLTYPETVTGVRTTPRSLVQFFERIAALPDLRADLDLVTMLGDACLDSSTVSAFVAFVNNDLDILVTPEEILGARDFAPVAERLAELGGRGGRRVDLLATVCTRVVNHLRQRTTRLDATAVANLRGLLTLEALPADMRLAMAQDLMLLDRSLGATRVLADKAVGRLLLDLAAVPS
ncbi:AAA family ATPase [Actinoplanes sp. NPDC026670]|uniref:AAA family ATPase n=1 Tax=Actinoplanes sp. NPDC026670 TaxID=3154700 RepID=UPI0033F44B25